MQTPYEIRLYPNRRLYDVRRSRYISYDDVYELIRNGIVPTVRQTDGDRDCTLKVLLDIFIREELAAPEHPILTEQTLKQLIRTGAGSMACLCAPFLEHSLQALATCAEDGKSSPALASRRVK